MFVVPKVRSLDRWGSGHYGAPRGNREHKGVDLAVDAGTRVYAHFDGEVTKIGYPYGDDLSFRYVQISKDGLDHRYFYISPEVSKGDKVKTGDLIGVTQKLGNRYPEITEHFHYEIKKDGKYVDLSKI